MRLIDKKFARKKLKINTQKTCSCLFSDLAYKQHTKYAAEMEKLRKDYYVITKAHHCTFRLPNKRKDLETLCKISYMVLEGNSLFEEAAMVADIAVCEARSGSCLETVYLSRNVRLVPISAKEKIDGNYYKGLKDIGAAVCYPQELAQAVRNAKVPNFDISYFYGPVDGNSTARAADAIIKELET